MQLGGQKRLQLYRITTITWKAIDANGNVSAKTQRVTIIDTTPPVLTVPADIMAEAIAIRTVVNIGSATASDIFNINILNDGPTDYALGTTTVTWTATDASGNITKGHQLITIVDTTPPVLIVPSSITVEAQAIQTEVNIGTATASDIFNVTVKNDAPLAFNLGITTVIWTATDVNGNATVKTQRVTVVHTNHLVLTIPADIVRKRPVLKRQYL